MVIFEPSSIVLQCRKYQEIITSRSPVEWADILGVEFVDPSDLSPTFDADFAKTA